MSYFLKKTNNKKGTYLQIYESYYDPERKGGAHRSYKPIGYVHELVESGIDDPISHFQAEIDELNRKHIAKKQAEKSKTISDESPEKFLGYFPLKNLTNNMRKIFANIINLIYQIFCKFMSIINSPTTSNTRCNRF